MSTHITAILFPCLDSMMMFDWLPKLGEKAFVAWLRLHSWKDSSASSSPVVLPLSINRIIKRLKVGNSTFYDQILRPLWNYGLIDLKKADPHKKEQHLVLYTYPYNDPTKSSSPLLQMRDYDLDPSKEDSPIPSLAEEINSQEESIPLPSPEEQPAAPSSLPSSPSVIQEDPAPYLKENTEKSTNDLSFPSLPPQIQKAIQENPEWQTRAQSIQQVYERCKDHPDHDDEEFLQKVHTCIRYPHDPKRFAAYLLKSIYNEWNKKRTLKPKPDSLATLSHPSEPTTPAISPLRKKESSLYRTDVPEWVRKQQENLPSDEPNDLNPEQQAEINRLLKALGEI